MVISADIGAGHDAAAAELGRRLAVRGLRVDRVNLLSLLPPPFPIVVRQVYRGMLRWLPSGYELLFGLFGRSPALMDAIRGVLRPAGRRLVARLPADTRAVVTTFPFANQVVGPLRELGYSGTVLTYVTDFVLHPAWLAAGVDEYCVIHDAVRDQARAMGVRRTRVVDALVSPRFPASGGVGRAEARRRFGLPEEERLALIVAGSWGVGEVERTAADVLASGCVRPVVVCGRNEALRRRLRGYPGYVFGWVGDMPTLMSAVDVLVENAGGLTCQESLAVGLPTITYRPIPGHGIANARVLAGCGLTRYVETPAELSRTLRDVVAAGRTAPRAATGRDMAAMVLDAIAAQTPSREQ
ncbi:UDP-N-acetylglucosamine:LPS N-acetylglucosamine transferase [Micromonospora pattaloongensis]|uniref:UDP-N-acetylglucosamine:LPS N-acetylglucosamine transferase n=1 Tax=Micromonospora pattaloongensis TaxID=405436 RepID=A0A1H3JLD0_9ACTN|nr:glycosyltransferase [Micromonospora pattaloongensis]SDY40335.1 UDP-N-acetylglucosamine:LPS N-acetylglucosamine transferase [Micromonospora pattaloongensis]